MLGGRRGRMKRRKDGLALAITLLVLLLPLAQLRPVSPPSSAWPSLAHAFLRRLRGQPLAKPDYTIYHHKWEGTCCSMLECAETEHGKLFLNREALLKEVQDVVAANTGIMSLEVRHLEDKGYKVDMQVRPN